MTTAARSAGPLAALRALDLNPVLVKEMRSRFRGARAFAVLTAFLLLLMGILALFAGLQSALEWFTSGISMPSASTPGSPGNQMAAVYGRALYTLLVGCEMVVVMLIGPALTMSTISGEVERQTLDLLLATPLSGNTILRGKVGAAMGYILLLVLSALPVMSAISLLGGVSAGEVLVNQVQVLTTGLLFVMLGAFFSAVTRSTARAGILSYLFIGLKLFFTFFGLAFFGLYSVMGNATTVSELCLMGGFGIPTYFGHLPGIGSIFAPMWGGMIDTDAFTRGLVAFNAVTLQLLLAMLMYTVAGARIRRADRHAAHRATLLCFFLWIWAIWATVSEGIFTSSGSALLGIPDYGLSIAAGAALPVIPGLLWITALLLIGRRRPRARDEHR